MSLKSTSQKSNSVFDHWLVREITIVLIIKMMIIWVLWFSFFRAPPPLMTDKDRIEYHILNSSSDQNKFVSREAQ